MDTLYTKAKENQVTTRAIVNIGQTYTEVEPALQHPAPLHTLQKMVTAAVF